MRITIVTVGTQGDARPFAAVGRELVRRGHQVTVLTDARHGELLARAGVRHAPLSADPLDVLSGFVESLDRNRQLSIARITRKYLVKQAPEWAEQCLDAAKDADLLIGSGIGTALTGTVAQKLGIRWAQAQFMPITPSSTIPPLFPAHPVSLPPDLNLALSRGMRLVSWRAVADSANTLRDRMELPRFPWSGPWSEEFVRQTPILYAYSRHVFPAAPDWGDRIRVTGFCFFDESTSWKPPLSLTDFLAAGEMPIYVGFGSMITGDRQGLTRVVLDAVRRSGKRAVIATGWGALEATQDHDDRVLFIPDAPHDWLFPRVRMAVHHGGAGTMAAAARAGLPQVIVPFSFDQFLWRWQIGRLGVGPRARIQRAGLTAERLARAIVATDNEITAARARALGEKLKSEDGVRNAIDALQGWGLLEAPSRVAQAGSG